MWARFFGSSLEDRLRYTSSDCFETFPFPRGWHADPALEAAGKAYYKFRANLMIRNGQGLTKTYNRFHDPTERDTVIVKLRELHAELDRAILDAYGWTDVPVKCEFLLEHENDADANSRRKKPHRYRWPDEVRNDVLGRLLNLNAVRVRDQNRTAAAVGNPRRTGAQR